MSIINNLMKANAAVMIDLAKKLANPNDQNLGKLAPRINEMAIEALTKGIGSDAWRDYMWLFASNEDELAQLTDPEKPERENNPWLKQMRAYIVSNAICDISTWGKTHDRIGPDINIQTDTEDAGFIAQRKIQFPPV